MLKKTMSYTDYFGNQRKEDFYFNMNEQELAEMNFSESGGMDQLIDKIIQTQNIPKLTELFKQMIDLSYGVPTPDGRGFNKSPEILAEFKATVAYSDLYMELVRDENKAAEFLNGIIPSGVKLSKEEIDAKVKELMDTSPESIQENKPELSVVESNTGSPE